ncbi:MAG: Ppx/GppA phosphatase family protein [Thermodesulfovibrionia bacterium]|nr:Ppx/GppA phosphatase family protein [Thermodesulfovibrionia bacterium]
MKPRVLAGIDIGTNTFRLLIGEVSNNSIKSIYSKRIITRLGEGVSINNILRPEAIKRSIDALKEFREIIDAHNTEATSAIGTSVLREANNRDYFLTEAMQETGIEIKIASKSEEAAFSSSGMMIDLEVPGSALLIDIGGGSTEFIMTSDGKQVFFESLNLGAVYLHDMYIKSDPPAAEEIFMMEKEISRHLDAIAVSINKHISVETSLIGTAGTITALSATAQNLCEFQHERIHNSNISIQDVIYMYSKMSKATIRERLGLYPVLEPSRADIILPGTAILLKIMMALGFDRITVSNYGLREGIILNLYNRISA